MGNSSSMTSQDSGYFSTNSVSLHKIFNLSGFIFWVFMRFNIQFSDPIFRGLWLLLHFRDLIFILNFQILSSKKNKILPLRVERYIIISWTLI